MEEIHLTKEEIINKKKSKDMSQSYITFRLSSDEEYSISREEYLKYPYHEEITMNTNYNINISFISQSELLNILNICKLNPNNAGDIQEDYFCHKTIEELKLFIYISILINLNKFAYEIALDILLTKEGANNTRKFFRAFPLYNPKISQEINAGILKLFNKKNGNQNSSKWMNLRSEKDSSMGLQDKEYGIWYLQLELKYGNIYIYIYRIWAII